MKPIPSEAAEKATALRTMGVSWARISRTVGYGEERIRRAIDPTFGARRAAGIREARYSRGFRGEPHLKLSPAETQAALATVPPDTRPLSARLMGDPLPGRSALDKLSAGERNKNHEYREMRDYLLAPQKSPVFIGDHLKSGRVV
jgi:hypothetical protein